MFLFSILMVFQFGQYSCEDLVTFTSSVRIPTKMDNTNVAYDNYDSIYIFGGRGYYGSILQPQKEIYRYSISSDSLSTLDVTLPNPTYSGGIIVDAFSNILYFGGYNGSTQYARQAIKFSTFDNTLTPIGTLSVGFGFGAVVKGGEGMDPNRAYLIGGFERSNQGFTVQWTYIGQDQVEIPLGIDITTIRCINMENLETCGESQIGQERNQRTVAFSHSSKAYIFGRTKGYVEIVDLQTLQSTNHSVQVPHFAYRTSVVYDGTYAYFIGGYDNSELFPNNALIRLDPETLESENFSVANYPAAITGPYGIFRETASTYVENLHRVYFFGAYSNYEGGATVHDEIWWIDLPTKDK